MAQVASLSAFAERHITYTNSTWYATYVQTVDFSLDAGGGPRYSSIGKREDLGHEPRSLMPPEVIEDGTLAGDTGIISQTEREVNRSFPPPG